MQFFSDYIKVCKAEWLKLKGSGMFWLTLIMAAFIPAIFTMAGLLQNESSIVSVNTANPWKELLSNCFMGFGGFFFPIFLTLVVIRLTQMEHSGGGWKLIETQPVSKASLYLGKFSMALILSFFCIVALVLYSLFSGTILMLIKNASGFSTNSIPFDFISGLSFRLFIAGLGILGIQFLFSVVISGFLWPFSIGLAATITGAIVTGFGYALWWPYATPGMTVRNPEGSATGNFLLYYEWLSIAWLLLSLWLGYLWYQRKTLKRAFFKPISRIAYLLVPVVLFAAFFRYINQPVQIPAHDRTVISGTVESNVPIKMAYLIAEPLMDTILEIPVNKNSFHFIADKKITPGEYYFKAGNMQPNKIFFGSNDSLNIRIKSDGKSSNFTTHGNRLPENEYLKSAAAANNYQLYYLENFGFEMKPAGFAKELKQQWDGEMKKIDDYKTADNLKPAEDFILLQKKLSTLRYINLLDLKYTQWFKIYHPNEKLVLPKYVDEIKNTVTYNDSSLMRYAQYREFVTAYYEKTYKLASSSDTAYLNKTLKALPKGAVRDELIFNRLKEAVGRIRDSIDRKEILAAYAQSISQEKMQHQLLAQHQLLNSLSRGKTAPDFKTAALNKDSFSLKDFKGRYVVIDVWATWCIPCKVQSPNFERLAEQYTNSNLAFVALSIDDNKTKWRNEANDRSARVLQLIADDKNILEKDYGIETIPRFMLIGPDGKIINIQMPYPSDPLFEDLLKRDIPGIGTNQRN